MPYPQQSPHVAQEVSQTPPVQNVQPTGDGSSSSANTRRPNNSVQTAAASLETVERALGDLRVSNGVVSGRGGRRGHGHGHHGQEALTVPTTEFDFQSSNARFDKAALGPKKAKGSEDDKPSDADSPADEQKAEDQAYNPSRSFFDNLSSSTQAAPPPQRGRRGGGARSRREEERERNVATFGEPGGVGLMGPGAYVGGYGGHGRRGGRPRRGAPAVAGNGR